MTAPATESAIEEVVPVEAVIATVERVLSWLETEIFNLDVAIQLGLIAAAILPALIFAPRLKSILLAVLEQRIEISLVQRVLSALVVLVIPIALWIVLGLITLGLNTLGRPDEWAEAAISLLTAWLVIRAVTLIIRSKFWSSIAFYIAWPIAVLDLFGLLDDVILQLQALAIPLGENTDGEPVDLSVFDVIRTLIYFGVLFWAASFAGRLIDQQLEKSSEISPTFRTLITKILSFALPAIALVVALQMTGFNLATLAIFSGAIGIGIGLGLQQTVANIAAGFSLLADKSIKPGDSIEIDGVFGWVTEMRSRYVAIRTRDGTEMLIPNEQFMLNGVTNWSHSDQVVRLHAPFGVTYAQDDLRVVQELAVQAAQSVDRVVSTPSPVCNVMEFGDNSVNFDLRFWISDPQQGQSNVRSDVYLALWERLKTAGIEIPFPQRDIYIKQMPDQAASELD